MNSRFAWAATAAIVLCAAALLALTPRGNAAPSVANGVLSLSGATTSQTLYDNLPAEQFAVSVKVNSGSATIEGTADGVLWASLGTLVAGSGCVFEGSYQAVRAVGASASGSYEVRSPTDVANEDDRVGTLNGLMLSGSMRVYHSGTDHNRHMRVKAITGTVQVLDEAGATVIAEIDPGDAAMIHDECDRLWLTGSGAVADVILFDANPDPDGQQPAGNANDEGEAHAGKRYAIRVGQPLGRLDVALGDVRACIHAMDPPAGAAVGAARCGVAPGRNPRAVAFGHVDRNPLRHPNHVFVLAADRLVGLDQLFVLALKLSQAL